MLVGSCCFWTCIDPSLRWIPLHDYSFCHYWCMLMRRTMSLLFSNPSTMASAWTGLLNIAFLHLVAKRWPLLHPGTLVMNMTLIAFRFPSTHHFSQRFAGGKTFIFPTNVVVSLSSLSQGDAIWDASRGISLQLYIYYLFHVFTVCIMIVAMCIHILYIYIYIIIYERPASWGPLFSIKTVVFYTCFEDPLYVHDSVSHVHMNRT